MCGFRWVAAAEAGGRGRAVRAPCPPASAPTPGGRRRRRSLSEGGPRETRGRGKGGRGVGAVLVGARGVCPPCGPSASGVHWVVLARPSTLQAEGETREGRQGAPRLPLRPATTTPLLCTRVGHSACTKSLMPLAVHSLRLSRAGRRAPPAAGSAPPAAVVVMFPARAPAASSSSSHYLWSCGGGTGPGGSQNWPAAREKPSGGKVGAEVGASGAGTRAGQGAQEAGPRPHVHHPPTPPAHPTTSPSPLVRQPASPRSVVSPSLAVGGSRSSPSLTRRCSPPAVARRRESPRPSKKCAARSGRRGAGSEEGGERGGRGGRARARPAWAGHGPTPTAAPRFFLSPTHPPTTTTTSSLKSPPPQNSQALSAMKPIETGPKPLGPAGALAKARTSGRSASSPSRA